MGSHQNAIERRNYRRISYLPHAHARFDAEGQTFQVVDISQCGFRIVRKPGLALDGKFQGKVTFLSGADVEVEVCLEWEEDEQAGLSLIGLLPATLIEAENRHLILKFG